MRRVIVTAMLAVAFVATSSVNASAFGLFDKLCKSDCDSGCAAEPACGLEAACGCAAEPACGCEAPAPACGCEAVDPCCDSGCSRPKLGLLKKLFSKHNACGCDSGCAAEPACGLEAACCAAEPACGCEAPAPTCGCEVVDPCCDAPKCGGKVRGLLSKLFNKHKGCGCDSCDSGCAAEPACGCEPTCGCN
jgi:hypothetical protein